MTRATISRALAPLAWLARKRWFQIYLALLLISHLVITLAAPDFWIGYHLPPPTDRSTITVPTMSDDAPLDSRTTNLAVLHWESKVPEARHLPILLLHGSPSQGARDFKRFGPALAERGFDVYALDRPGFGASDKWVPSYSIKANARYALAALDELDIDRVHAVGWSQSGGVVLWMADLAPQRLASLTLLGAIGIQEGEGSGNYHFEHFKYAMGYAALVVAAELIPHFNLIGDRAVRHAFIRDFWDTDQRPLRAIMESLQTPTLILQGRTDPLVHAWVAQAHHDIIEPSRLVMLDASHFFPIGEPMDSTENLDRAADALADFAARHDTPGTPVRHGAVDFAPDLTADDPTLGPLHLTPTSPWWLVILAIVLATLVSEDLTVIAVGLLIVSGRIDAGVGLAGCFLGIAIGDYSLWAIGRFAGRRALRWPFFRRILPEPSLEKWRRIFDRHVAKTVFISRMLPGTRLPMYLAAGILAKRSKLFLFWVTIAVAVWTPILLVLTAIIGPGLLGFFENIFHGPWAILAAFFVLYLLIRFVEYEATALGRQRLKADLKRLVSVEFWPPWLFYLPLAPYALWLIARYRGPMTFTCSNPGIDNGGGVIGESKTAIARGFENAPTKILHQVLIPQGLPPDQRADHAITHINDDPDLAGFPVILKPDVAQRGHGVKLAKSEEDVRAYFRSMTRDAVIQRYHAGPGEVGVLWARIPNPDTPADQLEGEIFSITRKRFPVIQGDGKRTLERIIWEHPRFRMQARTFLKRFDAQSDRVLEDGEILRLAIAGNHCQGTMFTDGQDLITPELTKAVDDIARAFRHPDTGAAVDFGRFDIRYADDDALKNAENFALVEFNGTMSESTNIYDPEKSVLWTYAVLFRQWTRLFRLGAIRRRQGVRPLRIRSLYRLVRDHYRGRPGSPVSD